MTSQQKERQPLLRELRDASSNDVTEQGQISGRTVRNLLMANGIVALVSVGGFLYSMNLTQYVYARIVSKMFGSNFSTPDRRPCFSNASSPEHKRVSLAQSSASDKSLQFDLALALPSLLAILLLGAYSDHLGRRFLFFASFVGFILRDGVAAAVVFFDLDLNWMFLGIVLNGCCGGTYTVTLAVNAYTADNTPATRVRTMGIALAEVGSALSTIAGLLGGGYFIQAVGFFYPFLATNGLLILAIVLTAFFLEEADHFRSSGGSIRHWPSPLQAVKCVFDFYFSKSVSASAEPAAAKRDRGVSVRGESAEVVQHAVTFDRRLENSLGIAAFFLAVLPSIGLGRINMLYVMNQPFCWDSKTMGLYNAVRVVLQHFLGIAALKTLSSRVREEWIGVMGFLSMGGGFLVMAFAAHDWMLYVAPVVGVIASLAAVVVTSLMSQRAPYSKQGSLFAGVGVLETACSAVGSLLFSSVYSATVGTVRGATYLLTSALAALGVGFMGAYIYVIRREPNTSSAVTIQTPEVNEELLE